MNTRAVAIVTGIVLSVIPVAARGQQSAGSADTLGVGVHAPGSVAPSGASR